MAEVRRCAENVPDDGQTHFCPDPLRPFGVARRQEIHEARAHAGTLQKQKHDQSGHGQQLGNQRGRTLADGKGRFRQFRPELLQLGSVLVDPLLQVIVLYQPSDDTASLPRVGDVRGNCVGKVRQPARQRIAKRDREAHEGQSADGDHDTNGVPAPT